MANTTIDANKVSEFMQHIGCTVIEVPERNIKFVLTSTNMSVEEIAQSKDPTPTDMLVKLFEMQSKLNDYTFAKMDISPVQCDHPLSMKHLQAQAQRGTDNSANGDVNTWLNKYLWALMTECEEVKEELLSKWWSAKEINIDNIQKEVVDVLHFFISLAITSGMTAQTLFNKYVEKNAVNFKRLDSGYAPENS